MQLTIFIKTMLDCLNYMLADNGYYQIDALEYAFYLGVNPVIPDRSESMKNNGNSTIIILSLNATCHIILIKNHFYVHMVRI